MSEFLPDFSSPEALAASYDRRAEDMRKAADEATDEGNRRRFMDYAQNAEERAADIRARLSNANA